MLWWTLRKLQSEDSSKRREAIKKLEDDHSPRAIEAIIGALTDSSWSVQSQASEALCRLGKDSLGPLLAHLADRSSSRRHAILSMLGQMKEAAAAVPQITKMLHDEDRGIRWQAILTLEEIKGARAHEPLRECAVEFLKDEDIRIREHAATLVANLGDARAMPVLIEMLSDKKNANEFRIKAAKALGELKASEAFEAIEHLVLALKDDEGPVREAARRVLTGRVGHQWGKSDGARKAAKTLIQLFKESDHWTVREFVPGIISEIDDPCVVDFFMAALADGSLNKGVAEDCLGRIDPQWRQSEKAETAVVELIAALKNQDKRTRQHAAEALGSIRSPIALEALLEALSDKRKVVRIAAAEALETIKDPRAVVPLLPLLGDQDQEVRETVVDILCRWGDVRASWFLVNRLEHEPGSEAARKLVFALGCAGDASAVDILLAILQNDQRKSDLAIFALEKVLQRDAAGISEYDLRRVLALSGIKTVVWHSSEDLDRYQGWEGTEAVDCSHVKQLAREELTRRGLEG